MKATRTVDQEKAKNSQYPGVQLLNLKDLIIINQLNNKFELTKF